MRKEKLRDVKDRGELLVCVCVYTWYQSRYLLLQGSWDCVSQFSEDTEATLSRPNALLPQLSVKSLDYQRHLNTPDTKLAVTHFTRNLP